MAPDEIQLLDARGNLAVVQRAARRFPGVLVQGDTLATLVEDARTLAAAAAHAGPEVREPAADLAEALSEILAYYASTLDAHGIPLPYRPTPD